MQPLNREKLREFNIVQHELSGIYHADVSDLEDLRAEAYREGLEAAAIKLDAKAVKMMENQEQETDFGTVAFLIEGLAESIRNLTDSKEHKP